MDTPQTHLFNRVRRLVNRLVFLEKKSVFAFAGVRLHPSEIHVLHAVLAEPEVNVTGLAAALGVTLGAVSQTLTRLQAKGMVVKRAEPASRNEIRIQFTETGRAAITRFLDERSALWRRHQAYLEALPECDRKAVEGFLASLDAVVDDLE